MRIFFTRFPLESRYGGAEVQTLSLMKGLKEKGHDVRFLGSCPTLLKKTKEIGIPSDELDIGDPPVTKFGVVSFLWQQFGMRRKLTEIVEGVLCPVGALHATPLRGTPVHHGVTIFMLSLTEKLLLTDWCVKNGMNVIWIEHDRVGRWLTKNPWLPKLRKLSKHVKTVTVSELSRKIYVKLGWRAEDVVAIPNGIVCHPERSGSCYASSPPPLRYGSAQHDTAATETKGDTRFNLGCLSRLTHDKGVDLLINAVNSIPGVSLTVVGSGKEEKNLKELAKPSGSRIKFISHIDDLNDFYSSIDVLVLPSRENDPFGICVAEAMVAGIPTIITDACGIASHLEESESIIVKADNVDALKIAIEEVQKPEIWKLLSKIGPNVVKERFSVEKMVEKYGQLL